MKTTSNISKYFFFFCLLNCIAQADEESDVFTRLQNHNTREYQLLENQLEKFNIEEKKNFTADIFNKLKNKKPLTRTLPKNTVLYNYQNKSYFLSAKKMYVKAWYLDYSKELCFFKNDQEIIYTLVCSDLRSLPEAANIQPVPQKYQPYAYQNMESYTEFDQYPMPKVGFIFSTGTNYGTYTKDILGEENTLTAPFQKYQIQGLLNSKANFIFGILAEHQRDTFYLSRAGKGYLTGNSLGLYLETKSIPFYKRKLSLSTELTWGEIQLIETHPGERISLDFIHNSMAINLNHLTSINEKWEYIMGLKLERKWKKMVKVKYFVEREDESIQDDLLGFFFGFRRKINAF